MRRFLEIFIVKFAVRFLDVFTVTFFEKVVAVQVLLISLSVGKISYDIDSIVSEEVKNE